MDNKETFKMTYSARQQDEIQSIRKKYLPVEEDKMERLRALDNGATQKATAAAITVGAVGTIIMGFGMSLVMSDFGKIFGEISMPIGIITGVMGIGILVCAYPLYNRKLKKEREKIAPEVIKLTEELMK